MCKFMLSFWLILLFCELISAIYYHLSFGIVCTGSILQILFIEGVNEYRLSGFCLVF